ncbi:TRPM8 channel-associated factor homolog isoform X2 [Acanthopagrus latus]|uniref:TRPM8 channel-associated factor homolog isoform X2 n=1 Tax=Acanthopagrus latus TaxID=8177 RepID=UPI00187CB232|nr:TRPM8 channel-associated factor homolog isoform X2 [Acanthopagrus latus]
MSNQPTQNQHEATYLSLMRGLRELDLRGPAVPSDLVLIGDHAFPLAMNSQGQVLMAASLYGSGRIVVLGHEAYLTAFPALVENALTWLRGDGSDNLSVGVHNNVRAVADNLSRSSFKAEVVGAFSKNLGVGVYVTDAYSVGAHVDLVAFMKAGGGVLIAGQAWSWAGAHPKENTLLLFDGNKVSGVAGIYFSDRHGEVEYLPVYPQIPSSWMSVVIGKDFEDDLEFLLQGISNFDLKDAPVSEILIHGPLAFPIAITKCGQAFVAGAYYGQGRVIVITHEGLFNWETLAPFCINAIHWLDEGRQGVVGLEPGFEQAREHFSKSGLKCESTYFREDLSVFVCSLYNDGLAEKIQEFVAEGGGLLIGGHCWHWAQTHPGQNPLTDFAGNKILNKMGLSVLGNVIWGGVHEAPEPSRAIKDTYHFRHLLNRFASHVAQGQELTQHEEECLKKLGSDCATYLHMEAHDCTSYTQVVSTITDLIKKSDIPQVCGSCPVTTPKDHLLLSVAAEVYKVCPDPDALLPSLIKNNPLLPVVYNYRIKINTKTGGGEEWISTGLYLSPGMKTYISLPEEIVNKDWKIQIGCQTDHLCHEVLLRAPHVHEQFPVTSNMMQVWNLWGGLIYLVSPPNTQVEGLEVTVQMAVPAPYYKSGVTTAAQWSLLRTAPSPWAELEFDNIILTVPSKAIRNLDRPDELATLWNDIMRGIADLAVIPHKFARKERFVADVQISHGWMHAGYPVMIHETAADELINVKNARTNGIWGPIHELGHNQQRCCWEFPPNTTECTCNLWALYVHEEVLGVSRTQLQEKFGWDAFKKVFAAYHKMSDFPHDNKGKMNLYAETFSQIVKMNLAGFFKAWSWPIETATEEKLSNLPPWSDHPMTQFD